MVGRTLIRTGVPSTYYVTLDNSGAADAYYVQWTIMLSPGLQFSFPAGPLQVSQPDTNAGLNGNYYTESDGTIVIPFLAFHVPAGSSLSVPYSQPCLLHQQCEYAWNVRMVARRSTECESGYRPISKSDAFRTRSWWAACRRSADLDNFLAALLHLQPLS